jgi:hypothetical protein
MINSDVNSKMSADMEAHTGNQQEDLYRLIR